MPYAGAPAPAAPGVPYQQGAPYQGQPTAPPPPGAGYPYGQPPAGYVQAPGQYGYVKPPRQPGKPADPWLRIGARVVDFILLWVIGFFPSMVGSVIATMGQILIMQGDNFTGAGVQSPNWSMLFSATLYALLRFINDVILVHAFGGTVGKLIFQLRVVNLETREKLSFGATCLRFLVLYGPMLVAFLAAALFPTIVTNLIAVCSPVWYMVILVSFLMAKPLYSGLHDRAATSIVVNKPQ